VPVGLAAAAATWAVYRSRETETKALPIDGVGLALLVTWVGSLQIMLDKGKDLDWFHSGQIVLLTAVAIIGFLCFVAWELTEAHPVVDLRLFARRNFVVGTLTLSMAYLLYFGNVVVLPLWLQQYMGYNATAAGMALAPVGLLAIVLSPLVGRNVNRVDPRFITTASFAVFALVLWMRSRFTTGADELTILWPTLLQGAAVAGFFIPLTTIVLSGLPPERLASAAGLSNFVRITAGAFGTSISTTLWDDRATLHHGHLVEHLGSAADPALADASARLAAAGLSPEQVAAQINRLVDQQAFTRAVDDVFLASALLFVLLIGLVWLSRRVRGGAASAEAAAAH
jgi:DHA2 family multidrug resistance protein